uniref:Protein ERP2 n=1 Tax=Rhipicephalus zambeziensis TaxID=60191 RepID=A0A224YWU1_9ACAR
MVCVGVVRLYRKHAVLDLLFGAVVFATLLDISRTKDVFEDAETELTVTLRAGGIECFHQPAKVGQILEVEYQVLDANFGNMEMQQNMDINFILKSPTGQELIKEQSRTEAIHRHEVKEPGDHTMCFDNSMSTVSSKTVYFEVYVDKTGGGSQEEDEWDAGEIPYSPELVYNDTYKDIKATIKKVHENLNQVTHYQDTKRAHEARDRNVQEHNFTRVNQFSMLFIVVMLVVGTVQVIMVRSLFEERSRLRKIFQYLS